MLNKSQTAQLYFNTQHSTGVRKFTSADNNELDNKTGSVNATHELSSALESFGKLGLTAPEPGHSFQVLTNFDNEEQAQAYVKELQSYYDN